MTKKNPPGATEGNQKNPDLSLMRNDYTAPSKQLIDARVASHDWHMSQAVLRCVAYDWDLKSSIDKHFSEVSPERQAILRDLISRFAQLRKEALALDEKVESELKGQFIDANQGA